MRLPFAETRDTEAGEELRTTPVALLRRRPQATREFLATIAIPRPGAADLEKTGAGQVGRTLDPVFARHGVLTGAVMAEPGDINGGCSIFGAKSDRSGPDPVAAIHSMPQCSSMRLTAKCGLAATICLLVSDAYVAKPLQLPHSCRTSISTYAFGGDRVTLSFDRERGLVIFDSGVSSTFEDGPLKVPYVVSPNSVEVFKTYVFPTDGTLPAELHSGLLTCVRQPNHHVGNRGFVGAQYQCQQGDRALSRYVFSPEGGLEAFAVVGFRPSEATFVLSDLKGVLSGC